MGSMTICMKKFTLQQLHIMVEWYMVSSGSSKKQDIMEVPH